LLREAELDMELPIVTKREVLLIAWGEAAAAAIYSGRWKLIRAEEKAWKEYQEHLEDLKCI
jgi:hypothetical protein